MAPLAEATGEPEPVSTSEVWMDGAVVTAPVYDRGGLLAGHVVTGPAVITEMDSTTLVLSGHAATVHASGSLLLAPVDHAGPESR